MKQFEQNKTTPSVTVVNKREESKSSSTTSSSGTKKKSLFSQKRAADKKNQENIKFQLPDIKDGDTVVLSEIIEKNTNVITDRAALPPSLPASNNVSRHFPDVIKIVDVDKKAESKPDKRSLFSQQFQQMKQSIRIPSNDSKVNVDSFGENSRILTGGGLDDNDDINSIHEENMKMLEQMSEQEILEEKEKLEKTIDPGLLQFLKNRKASVKPTVRVEDTPKDKPMKVEAVDLELESVKTDSSLPGLENARVETEKLRWAGEMPEVKTGQLSGFTARFGFDGRLLRPDSDVPVSAGLHHHGEDQEHPGYSVEEMMTLARSSNNRQRQIGLELVEAVLTVWWSGELDPSVEQNIVTELVRAGLVQVIRISVDSGETGVVVAGVKCLVSLLCCAEEERLLDWTVDTAQPGLAPLLDTGDTDHDETDLTDHQLVTSDVVLGLMRMDLLDRLYYLLSVETERFSDSVMVTGVLGIMVRLARHSLNISARICGHSLLRHMITHHWPHPLCVKLVRVLVSWDRDLALETVSGHQIIGALTTELARDNVDSLYSTQVSVECHKLWCQLLSWDLGQEVWSQLYPIMVSRLVSHECGSLDSAGHISDSSSAT